MAQVIYAGSAIIPAPFCAINSDPIVAGDQRRLGKTYTLTLTGQTISYKGSPQTGTLSGAGWGGPLGLFWQDSGDPSDENIAYDHKMAGNQIKQQALEDLFSVDGQWLEFDSPDGSMPMKCQPKNFKIIFAEGNWVNQVNYTITCETDILYLNGEVYQ